MTKTPRAGRSKRLHKPRGITRKQKAFADELLANPKLSATQAVARTYNAKTNNVQRNIASENMAKPIILEYLAEHGTTAEHTVIDVMLNARKRKEKPAFQRLALDSAEAILDRIHGKATSKTETTSVNTNVQVEASIELNDAFTAFLKDSTKQT